MFADKLINIEYVINIFDTTDICIQQLFIFLFFQRITDVIFYFSNGKYVTHFHVPVGSQ